ETTFVERCAVEPSVPLAGCARVEIDIGPGRDGRRSRHVAGGVVHESDEIRTRRLGATWGGERREITVGKVAGEITGQILEPGAELKARIARIARARVGTEQAKQTREAGSPRVPPHQDAPVSHSRPPRVPRASRLRATGMPGAYRWRSSPQRRGAAPRD